MKRQRENSIDLLSLEDQVLTSDNNQLHFDDMNPESSEMNDWLVCPQCHRGNLTPVLLN